MIKCPIPASSLFPRKQVFSMPCFLSFSADEPSHDLSIFPCGASLKNNNHEKISIQKIR
jgi:hypothetical protein